MVTCLTTLIICSPFGHLRLEGLKRLLLHFVGDFRLEAERLFVVRWGFQALAVRGRTLSVVSRAEGWMCVVAKALNEVNDLGVMLSAA